MKKIFYCSAILTMLLTGCAKEYDDTSIKERVNTLEEQVQANANAIKALENKLEDATKKGLTVTVTPIQGGNKLTFSDGTSITVMNGVDGQTGPQGPGGEPGKDAQVSIKESPDGEAYLISFDNKEYSIRKGVIFSFQLECVDVSLAPGDSQEIAYTLTDSDASTKVFVSADSGYSAKVDMTNKKVIVTAPEELPDDGFIVITAVKNSTGETSSQYISFVKGSLTVTADAEVVSAAGGVVTLTVTADCDYKVNIPENCDWISQVNTRAMTTTYVKLNVAANDSGESRSATIIISSSAGNKTIVIAQASDIMEAANCFIVSEAGTYKFKTVKGNSAESVGEVSSCELLWETFNTETYPQENSLISSVSYANGVITFETVNPYLEGNAAIAAKDASGKILWSWHIWLTDSPKEQVYYNNAGILMDRNLGAYSTTPGHVSSLGFTYQWGRKDPFLSSAAIDTFVEVGSTGDWYVMNSTAEIGTIEYAIANPTTYIAYEDDGWDGNNSDWFHTGSTDDYNVDNTRWNPSTKTIYDPCPAGWRVPAGGSDGVWATAIGTNTIEGTKLFDTVNKGFNLSGMFGDDETIWYPLIGYRGNLIGNHSQVGLDTGWWSATPRDGHYRARRLMLYTDGAIGANSSYDRAVGYPVRCAKE